MPNTAVAELQRELLAEQARRSALEETIDALRAEQLAPRHGDGGVEHRQPTAGAVHFRKLRRLQQIIKGENVLMTGRVASLIEQNRGLAASMSTLESEVIRLRNHVTFCTAAAAAFISAY